MREAPGTGGIRAFGQYLLDADRGCLLLAGTEVPLRPKTFALLSYLAANPGRLISKDELIRAVWRGAVVGDDVLVQSVGELRRALGEAGAEIIRTVPRRGYRFEAEVAAAEAVSGALPEADSAPVSTAPAATAGTPRPAQRHRRWLLPAAALLLVLGAVSITVVIHSGRQADGSSEWVALLARNRTTISVAPFVNAGAHDHFVSGFTTDLIEALSRFSSLAVISLVPARPGVAGATTVGTPIRQPAAQYRIEGTVRQTAQSAIVTAQLLGPGGHVMGTARVEEPLADASALPEKLIQRISGMLAMKVENLEQKRVVLAKPRNPDAYDLLQQARALINAGRNELADARELLKRAIRLDPDYAAARSTLAVTYLVSAGNGWVESKPAALERARVSAVEALERDRNDNLAYLVLGQIHMHYSEHQQALQEMQRALRINPNHPLAQEAYGEALLWLGRTDDAITVLRAAQRTRPEMSGSAAFALALGHYLKGSYADAAAELNALQAVPLPFQETAVNPVLLLAACEARLGHVDVARRLLQEARAVDPAFDIRQFGTKLKNPQDLARLRQGLVMAGLEADGDLAAR